MSIRYGKITGAGLAHLAGLPNLETLEVSDSNVDDAGLARLSGVTKLKALKLRATEITDAGLTHLSGLKALETLDLSHTRIAGPGLVHLRGLTALKALDLQVTLVGDEPADALKEAIPGLVVTNKTWIQILAERVTRERGPPSRSADRPLTQHGIGE